MSTMLMSPDAQATANVRDNALYRTSRHVVCKRHKEVDIRFNDEPLLNWPVPNVAAKAVLFASLLLRRHSPIFHPGSIPAGDIAFDGGPQVISTEKGQPNEMEEEL
ncbi:hypothetical protein BCR43DRAFT_519479 [Syncephalastrum racemosum]|uniref:Uncharacterized protein n=1 Tax=Syncephalastrum racemosum TaxID=13706 RepID=A0A1X2H010_SYNRA|nr:hypothetical protein BCR43DRAFT_519479 [Syncephalastrum racemosum]